MKKIFLIIFAVFIVNSIFSQTILYPIVNIKSHKTLTIEKIEFSETQTVFYMSIENQKTTPGDAWFCADEKIYIKNAKGTEMFFMTKSEGIPVCPDAYKFKKPGDILKFKLYFQKIPTSIKEIDIVENCNDNCFYFYGVILDETQNTEIKLFEKGVTLYSTKNNEDALKCFEELIITVKDENSNIYAYSLYIVPLICYELGENEKAKNGFYKLKKSAIKDKDYFVNKLIKTEFFKNLE